MEAGYKYDFVERIGHMFAILPIKEKMALRYDHSFAGDENEIGFSYKIHNYITAEYVYNSEEGNWLRLIANL